MSRIGAAAIVMMLSVGAVGDVLTTNCGKVYSGNLVRQTDGEVIFEVHMYGGRFEKSFPVGEVAKIEEGKVLPKKSKPKKPEPKGLGYYIVPVVGTVGTEISADIMDVAIREMRLKKPDIVVLYIDSNGGDIREKTRFLKIIYDLADQYRVVAYVKNALSAAAIIALACPEICIAPDGQIGACVPYSVGPRGMPQILKEKSLSSVIAIDRTACEHGKHSVLLLKGMMDAEITLSLKKEDGRVVVVEGGEGEVLKLKGKILTLTAKEALRCGLAKAIGKTVHDVPAGLGIKEFHHIRGGAWIAMAKQGREARKQRCFEKIAPQLASIKTELADIRAAGKIAVAQKKLLRKQYDAELKSIETEYRENMSNATIWDGTDFVYVDIICNQAQINKERKMMELRSRYQPQIVAVNTNIAKLLYKKKVLNDKKKRLLIAGP